MTTSAQMDSMPKTALGQVSHGLAGAWFTDIPGVEFLRHTFAVGVEAMLSEVYRRVPGNHRSPTAWLATMANVPPTAGSDAVIDFTVRALVHALLGPDGRANDQDPVTSSTGGTSGSAMAAAMSWTTNNVVRQLRSVVGEVVRELDLPALESRLAIAAAVSTAALAVPFVDKSDRFIGQEVHDRLQRRYINSFQATNEIVSEEMAYRPGFPPTPLQQVAANPLSGAHFKILEVALNSWKSESRQLRTDLTDFGPVTLGRTGQLWEIKPVASAPTGVLQETYYRFLFNMVAPTIGGTSVTSVARMADGLMWPMPLLAPIGLSNHPTLNVPRIALPLCIPELPGLVLYAVIRAPTRFEWQAIMTLMTAELMRRIKKALDDLGKDAGALAQRAAELLGAFFQGLLKAAIFIAMLVVMLAFRVAQTASGLIIIVDPSSPTTSPRDTLASRRQSRDSQATVVISPGWRVSVGDFPKVLDFISRTGAASLDAGLAAVAGSLGVRPPTRAMV